MKSQLLVFAKSSFDRLAHTLLLASFVFLCILISDKAIGSDNPSLRAVNTARMRAEAINGGLGSYRTASCMYQQSGGLCLISNNQEGFRFRFYGGAPGWQQLGNAPTVETEILISNDGKHVLSVQYNGPPKQ